MPNKQHASHKKNRGGDHKHQRLSQAQTGSEQISQSNGQAHEPAERAQEARRNQKKTKPHNKLERLQQWTLRWENILKIIVPLIFSALIFGVTVAYTFVSYFQWRETIRTREIENRAFLGVKNAYLKTAPAAGKEVNPEIEIVNSGRTPARDMKLVLGIGLLPETKPEKLPTSVNHIPGRSVIMPGEHIMQKTPPPPVSDQDFSEKMRRGEKIYIWGTIEYNDFFGTHHKTEFCFFNEEVTSTNFVVCSSHNTYN